MRGAADISDIIRREHEHVARGLADSLREDFHRACDKLAEREIRREKCRCPMRPPMEERDTSNCPECKRPR